MDKLQQLIDRCRAGIYLTVNEHRMELRVPRPEWDEVSGVRVR